MSQNRSPEEIRERRKIEVALGYRLLAAKNWGDVGDGHISARDPEREDCFWVLRYGVSYHQVTVSDLVLVGPDGSLVEGDGERPDEALACAIGAREDTHDHLPCGAADAEIAWCPDML